MPSITIQNPLGAAVSSASSFAGGYAGQENQNRRQANADQGMALDAERQAAVLEGIEEERKIAAEERMRLAQARGDSQAFFDALAEARPEDVDPDQWLEQRQRRALQIAGRIAGRGGNPTGALAALEADTIAQAKELHRKKALEELSQGMKSGQLSSPGPDGKPMEPDADPYAAELDAIAAELDTPGIDPGPALEKLGRIRTEIAKERGAIKRREIRASQLQGASAAAMTGQIPTDALSDLAAQYESGQIDDKGLDEELVYARRGLKRVFHSDGSQGVYPFEEADQRAAEREAVMKKMAEMEMELEQARIDATKALAFDRMQPSARAAPKDPEQLTRKERLDLALDYDKAASAPSTDPADIERFRKIANQLRAGEDPGVSAPAPGDPGVTDAQIEGPAPSALKDIPDDQLRSKGIEMGQAIKDPTKKLAFAKAVLAEMKRRGVK